MQFVSKSLSPLKTTSYLLTIMGLSGFASSVVNASAGTFLLTDHPDNPSQHVKYENNPDNLNVSSAGFLKSGSDHYVLGWKFDHGAYPAMNGSENLGLVQLTDFDQPIMPTNHVDVSFNLPEQDANNTAYEHQWTLFDHNGNGRDVKAHIVKQSNENWQLYFSSSNAMSIYHDHPGGVMVNEHSSYTMNFDPVTGGLMDIMSPDHVPAAMPLNVCFEWNDPMHMGMSQNIMFNFGPVNGVAADPMATVVTQNPFSVKQTHHDGAGHAEISGGVVDAGGVLSTTYSNGLSVQSYQIAYIGLQNGGGFAFEQKPLGAATTNQINSLFNNQ